jgi:hypothetical protein
MTLPIDQKGFRNRLPPIRLAPKRERQSKPEAAGQDIGGGAAVEAGDALLGFTPTDELGFRFSPSLECFPPAPPQQFDGDGETRSFDSLTRGW